MGLTATSQSLPGGYEGDGASLFTMVHGRRTKDNACKLKRDKFRKMYGKAFISCGQPRTEISCQGELYHSITVC